MSKSFVTKHYYVNSTADSFARRFDQAIRKKGLVRVETPSDTALYRYPSLLFSSKRPFSCISHLTYDVEPSAGGVRVTVGVAFTRVRWFTILLMTCVCAVIPAAIGFSLSGYPDIPPMAFLGIPLGFMVHYHVRGRVFRAVKRLIYAIGA